MPPTTKTIYTLKDEDTETEVVCQVGVNARDALGSVIVQNIS